MRVAFAGALILVHAVAQAGSLCVPPTVERNSPHQFLVSMANALVYAKEGLDRVTEADTDLYSLVVVLRLQQSSYRCAASQVMPYEASSDSIISASAQATAGIFDRLSQVDDEFVSQAKVLLEPDGSFSAGEMAERQAQTQADLEQTWKVLIHAVALGTFAVVRADPITGKMARLSLTATERDEILAILRSGFGRGVADGIQAGQPALHASAAALYQFLSNPKWQLRSR